MNETNLAAPLSGIRVLEAASFFAGPHCGMLLADMGADVIKLERPLKGDPTRVRDDDTGYAPTFAAKNRNKRSLMLDLTQDAGLAVLEELLPTVDVVLTSIRPSSREKIGLNYAQVSSVNPRIVYCSVSGEGETPLTKDRPAFDTTAQGRSGLLSLVTKDFDSPMHVKALLSDLLAGFYAAYGVLGALAARDRTGQGQEVKTSLLEASVAFSDYAFYHMFVARAAGLERKRLALRTAGFLLTAGDDLPFAVHVPPSPVKNWKNFAAAIGADHLEGDPRFSTKHDREENYEALHSEVSKIVKTQSRAHWIEVLESQDVACAPIHDVSEAFDDPLVADLGMLYTVQDPWGDPQQVVGSGVSLSQTPLAMPQRAPLAGEHNREVLKQMGYDQARIHALEEEAVLVSRRLTEDDSP